MRSGRRSGSGVPMSGPAGPGDGPWCSRAAPAGAAGREMRRAHRSGRRSAAAGCGSSRSVPRGSAAREQQHDGPGAARSSGLGVGLDRGRVHAMRFGEIALERRNSPRSSAWKHLHRAGLRPATPSASAQRPVARRRRWSRRRPMVDRVEALQREDPESRGRHRRARKAEIVAHTITPSGARLGAGCAPAGPSPPCAPRRPSRPAPGSPSG